MIISLFETVRLSVSISPRNLYNSLKSIKENLFHFVLLDNCNSYCYRFVLHDNSTNSRSYHTKQSNQDYLFQMMLVEEQVAAILVFMHIMSLLSVSRQCLVVAKIQIKMYNNEG